MVDGENTGSLRFQDDRPTLSDSLAKNMAPLPTPSVPFFFFPLASTSEMAHVWMESACALLAVAATRSAGST